MSRLTRRSFTASAVMAGMGAANTSAQEATPEAAVSPSAILTAYIQYIWNGADDTRLVELFDVDGWDLDALQRQHDIWRDALLDTPSPVQVRDVTQNARSAVAFCTMNLANGEDYDAFIRITLDRKGLIRSYLWMAQPE